MRTTVALAAELLEAVDIAIKRGHAGSRTEFLEKALVMRLEAQRREEIDAAFAQMASDPDFQREAEQMCDEFAAADWESLRSVEGRR